MNTETPLSIIRGGELNTNEQLPQCLTDVLKHSADKFAHKALSFVNLANDTRRIDYAQLYQVAKQVACDLMVLGIEPKEHVMLYFDDQYDFIKVFWGCILSGVVPIPVAVEAITDSKAAALQTFRSSMQQFNCRRVLCSSTSLRNIEPYVSTLEHLTFHPMNSSGDPSVTEDFQIYRAQPDDLAFLLLTSGSTGTPKAVMHTHSTATHHLLSTSEVKGFEQNSSFFNWMPLEHVCALVAFHIAPLSVGADQYHAPKEDVLVEPLAWLKWMDQYRIAVTWAPTFAYNMLADLEADIQTLPLDLSCIEQFQAGGEMVVAKTLSKFAKILAPKGLAETAMRPGWGMSETCSAVAYTTHLDLDLASVSNGFVCLGYPIRGMEMKVVDSGGNLMPQGSIGSLYIKGPMLTVGYYNQPQETALMYTDDGWFITGDLARISDGQLTVTGRQKDIIIVNGVNYAAREIEAVVEDLDLENVVGVIACTFRPEAAHTDQIAIFIATETKALNEQRREEQMRAVRQALAKQKGLSVAKVIEIYKDEIPKTNIGKVNKSKLIAGLNRGEYAQAVRPPVPEASSANSIYASRPEIAEQLAKIWRTVLKLEDIDYAANIFEVGGNSVALVKIQHQVNNVFDVRLEAVDFFSHASINALSEHIAQLLGMNTVIEPATNTEVQKQPLQNLEDIAIVGMSCRFPGANTLAEFWYNLFNGVESIRPLSQDEQVLIDKDLIQHPNYIGFVSTVDCAELWDAQFFSFTPIEATNTEPQRRLLLECAYQALQDANVSPTQYTGRVGVFVGCGDNTYVENPFLTDRKRGEFASSAALKLAIGNNNDFAATQLAYKLGLTGPALNINTACSTSLVAIHQACRSIHCGDANMAIAGAASISTPQATGYLYEDGGICSPDGHCRPFDALGAGTVFGNGVGVIVLKPVSQAIADNDRIYALIKGSAINNDGYRKAGYTAPSVEGQADVIRAALANAKVSSDSIGYIEAHGTATNLGDPIELSALDRVFSPSQKNKIAIGSLKGNIGHLDTAAGVAGVIKTALAIQNGVLPPSLHYSTPNPHIDFSNSAFYVNNKLARWQGEGTRRAGVSSFGIGGTNAHVILEQAPTQEKRNIKKVIRDTYLFPLSAKSQTAFNRLIVAYLDFLYPMLQTNAESSIRLIDICRSAALGRDHFTVREAVVARSVEELYFGLLELKEQSQATQSHTTQSRADSEVIFICRATVIHGNLLLQLYNEFSAFAECVDECLDVAQSLGVTMSLSTLAQSSGASNRLIAHLIYELAVLKLFISWNVVPTRITAQKQGALVAAVVCGELSLSQALWLAAKYDAEQIQGQHYDCELLNEATDKLALLSGAQLSIGAEADQLRDFQYWLSQTEAGFTDFTVVTGVGDNNPIILSFGPENVTQSQQQHTSTHEICLSDNWKSVNKCLRALYQCNIDIDWQTVYANVAACSVALPTYPFDYRKFECLKSHSKQTGFAHYESHSRARDVRNGTELSHPYHRVSGLAEMLYHIAWHKQTLVQDERNLGPADWLVFEQQRPFFGELIKRKLEQSGVNAVCVQNVEQAHRYLTQMGARPFGLIYIPDTKASAVQSCHDYLDVLQRCISSDCVPQKLALITQQTVVFEQAFININTTPLMGLTKSFLMEYPNCKTSIIDCEVLDSQFVISLLGELAQPVTELHVAYRQQERYIGRLKSLGWPNDGPSQQHPVWAVQKTLSATGVYIVTGGLGGLGHHIIQWLVDRGAQHIIITSRGNSHNRFEKLRAKHQNAKLTLCVTDISTLESAQALSETVANKEIKGIFHVAGALSEGILPNQTAEKFNEVCRVKIAGMQHLSDVLQTHTPDFVIAFSSLAATIGFAGQANYCAANAYLDNVFTSPSHYCGLSVAWGAWSGEGQGDEGDVQKAMQRQGMEMLLPEEGMSIIDALVFDAGSPLYNPRHASITVAKITPSIFVPFRESLSFYEDLAPQNMVTAQNERVAEVVHEGDLSQQLITLLSGLTGLDSAQIDPDSGFMELGLDSLTLLDFKNQIQKQLAITLSTTALFNYNSITLLADHLTQSGVTLACAPNVSGEEKVRSRVYDTNQASISNDPAPVQSHAVTDNAIAVVGGSCLFPGKINSLDSFWQALLEKRDCIEEIPKDRWDVATYFDPDPDAPGKINNRWGGFVDGLKSFDAGFFGISPQEAKSVDPQQRMVLRTVWESLEHAAIDPDSLQGSKTGVFIGVASDEYKQLCLHDDPKNYKQFYGTGLSPSVIAGRVSYFLGTRGPSVVLDTACSSSLVAVHYGVQSLRNGESDLVVAGGVNSIVSPVSSIILAKAHMFSDSGRCKAFDAHADGYVKSEGCGIVVLMRQQDAIAQNRRILALICGSAINHDGKSSGLTVPNGLAQQAVINDALRNADIRPESVQFVEAHGSGTALGDPIEIDSLSNTYRGGAWQDEPLMIGAVKTNLGHLEAAAGIAGLLKTVMALHYKTVPANLHCHEPNPEIPWSSAIEMPSDAQLWPTQSAKARAGVSSFGFSGTNAHVILEAYDAHAPVKYEKVSGDKLFLLSARRQKNLMQSVANLIDWLEQAGREVELDDIAYTLQVGRKAMRYRLAVIAASYYELLAKLREVCNENERVVGTYQGKAVGRSLQTLTAFNDLQRIADHWVTGGQVDWRKLYTSFTPQTIALPSYAFSNDAHWIEKPTPVLKVSASRQNLHRVIHSNISTLKQHQYESSFNIDDFFLKDHVVNQVPHLPGVVYLEMAYAASRLAQPDEAVTTIRDVVWLSAVKGETPSITVRTSITPGPQNALNVAIESETHTKSKNTHCIGSVLKKPLHFCAPFDLPQLKQKCSDREASAVTVYEVFESVGIAYGESHRAIEHLAMGQHCVLAKVALPQSVSHTKDDFVLHPSIMDAALQATIGLNNKFPTQLSKEDLSLPFSIKQCTIYDSVSEAGWVYITNVQRKGVHKALTQIYVLDGGGRVLVAIDGFEARDIKPTPNKNTSKHADLNIPTSTITPELKALALSHIAKSPEQAQLVFSEHAQGVHELKKYLRVGQDHIIEETCDYADIITSFPHKIEHIVWMADGNASATRSSSHLFQLIRALLDNGFAIKQLQVTVMTITTPRSWAEAEMSAVHALAGTLSKELPSWHVRILNLEQWSDIPKAKPMALPSQTFGRSAFYRSDTWFTQSFKLVTFNTAHRETIYKQNGVYLVIGGAGGLGCAWTEGVLKEVNAQVIWLGRRPKNQHIQNEIQRLSQYGPAPHYMSIDCTSVSALRAAYEEILRNFGKLNGVIHSAMELSDQSLVKMQLSQFEQTMRNKADICLSIGQVFKAEPLDFLLFFSSFSGIYHPPGQANYNAGCAFKDAYSRLLGSVCDYPVKVINWGYWGSIGGGATSDLRAKMASQGVGSLEAAESFELMQQFIKSDQTQVAIYKNKQPVGKIFHSAR